MMMMSVIIIDDYDDVEKKEKVEERGEHIECNEGHDCHD